MPMEIGCPEGGDFQPDASTEGYLSKFFQDLYVEMYFPITVLYLEHTRAQVCKGFTKRGELVKIFLFSL